MKWIDIPPVWLAGALGLSWAQARFVPLGLSWPWPVVDFFAGLLIGGGLVLIALAVFEMRKQGTTVVPHQKADTLVTTGIFKRSRNPIYLADTMILLGVSVLWDAVLAIALVPIFLWIIEKRFVIDEENRLRVQFRERFARYCQNTRRWI
ncbi:MAG: isoprenylcysteine carboxylmethyltransferase family protein [Thalassovita sp.]